MARYRRQAGILLHPTSLPSGRLDAEAYRFVDWLAAAGCSWWQVLPLGIPDENGSPYASPSAFACSPALLADPDAPVSAAELAEYRTANRFWVDGWLELAGADALANQVRFEREWQALRRYAASRGVRVIGDLAIYVDGDSADCRAYPQYWRFELRSGTEPNRTHPDGQYWGHPVYDWQALAADGYRWWVERFRRMYALHDLVRVDHFRGLANFWAIPADSRNPADGYWLPGPGTALFDAVEAELGPRPLFVEEPGDLDPDVIDLRERLGAAGLGVLVRGFDGRLHSQHRPDHLRENQVVFTATHDNDTVCGWYASLAPAERERIPVDPAEPHWGLIELAAASPCRLSIAQAQDVLGLGSEARMNTPGTTGNGNWAWRLERGQLDRSAAERLRAVLARHGRCEPAEGTAGARPV